MTRLTRPVALAAFFILMSALPSGWVFSQEAVTFEDGDSLEVIQQKIDQNGYNFTVSHNWVFDMSPEDKKAFFSRRPTLEEMGISVSSDIGPLMEHLGGPLPSHFDWRDFCGRSYIGPVHNQGGCGSCYSFGAAAAGEGTYNFATGRYDASCSDLSESFIMWCLSELPEYQDHFGGCSGADYDYMELDALVNQGICSESDFSYRTSDPGSCTHWSDPRVQFASWHRVPCNDINAIKTAIMTYGVVDVAVNAGNAFQAYDNGIYQDAQTTCTGSPTCAYVTTNHAVALVGWDDAEGVFYLRNSWGSSWGEGGYMRISYTSARVACAVAYLVYGGSAPCAVTGYATVPASGEVNTGIQFRATGTAAAGCAGVPAFEWNFGDGQTSTDQNPIHTYATTGTFNWTLTTRTAGAADCVRTGSIAVTAGTCTLTCTATVPPAGQPGEPVPFASSATATGGACSGSPSFLWDFGDGQTSTDRIPSHTYAAAGSYTWLLTATVTGASGPCTRNGTIVVGTPACALSCTAAVQPTAATGTPVHFAATSHVNGSCSGTPAYGWNFGDGQASAEPSPEHVYGSAGTYDWTLTVTMPGAAPCTQTGSIVVTGAALPDLHGTWTKFKKRGSTIRATVTVTNGGAMASGGFRIAIYLSKTPTPGGGTRLVGEYSISALGPGTSAQTSIKVTPPRKYRNGYLIAVVDSQGSVAEGNESNNSASQGLS